MKGTVEVYKVYGDGSRECICSESNMIVDGAAESIVHFLTMPSSVAIIDNVIQERVLDASNYIIQGLAFGKGSLGYKNNAHKYKKHNLIPSAGDLLAIFPYLNRYNVTVSLSPEKNPFDLSSDVFTVYSNDNSAGGHFDFSGRTFANPANNKITFPNYLSGSYKAPYIFSVDLKRNWEYPSQPVVSGQGAGTGLTQIVVEHHGGVASGILRWNPITGAATTLSIRKDEQNIAIKELGSGWYKVAVVCPSGNDITNSGINVRIYPAGLSSLNSSVWQTDALAPGVGPSGGVFLSRPSLNIGSVPINYFLGQEPHFIESYDQQAFPLLCSSIATYDFGSTDGFAPSGFYMLSGPGTLRTNVSSYDACCSLPASQNPSMTRLEPDTETDYESSTDLDLNLGHTLNFMGFIGKDINVWKYLPDWTAMSGLTSMPLQRDLRWLGGGGGEYASTNFSTYYAVVSALDAEAFANPIRTTIENALTSSNRKRQIDLSGFRRAKYQELNEDGNSTAVGATPGYLSVSSSNITLHPNPKITYFASITPEDLNAYNMFGGIQTLGMYTFDYPKMLSNGLSPSAAFDKDVDTGDEPVYKLFCRKVLSDNIAAVSDTSSGATDYAGIENATNVDIKWSLEF